MLYDMLIWASVKKKNEKKKIVQERKTLEIVEYSKTSLSIHMT